MQSFMQGGGSDAEIIESMAMLANPAAVGASNRESAHGKSPRISDMVNCGGLLKNRVY